MSQSKKMKFSEFRPIDIYDDFSNKINNGLMQKLLTEPIKTQRVYLSPFDKDIEFDEINHTYLLPRKSKKFLLSVTGFCKKEIHNNEFIPAKVLRNMNIDVTNIDLDQHILRAIEWKYSSLFGSLFHALIEFFFNEIVNCTHPDCQQQQEYDEELYKKCQIQETNNYNLYLGCHTQATASHYTFHSIPTFPCKHTLLGFDVFMKLVDKELIKHVLCKNSYYSIDSITYKDDILKTIEEAFDNNANDMKAATRKYRSEINSSYCNSITDIIDKHFNYDTYFDDMKEHLKKFKVILEHLPLNECCDIRPEYIVYSEEKGLAGSIDLTMRKRDNPMHLLIYDWKTSKNIFRGFYRNKEMINQLTDYSCQLHTYANLISNRVSDYKIDLFVVNITRNDACIYYVKENVSCKCCTIFNDFSKNMIDI